jgi:hypothetical protein
MAHPEATEAIIAISCYLIQSLFAFRNVAAAELQQRSQKHENQHVAKCKQGEEEDIAILGLIVPKLVEIGHNFQRFWEDDWSQHWITHILNGNVLHDDVFEKAFCMNRDSFEHLHHLLSTYHHPHMVLLTYISIEPYIAKQDTRFRDAILS